MTEAAPSLWFSAAQFLALALAVVVVSRYLLIRGLEETSRAYGLPSKLQGQLLGYATSAPELVGTVATAARGLLGAGLWNVAASNIINCGLFLAAALYFRRGRTLMQRQFADEIGFALLAIGVPLLLTTSLGWARSPWTVLLLLGFFVLYILVDRKLNPEEVNEGAAAARAEGNGRLGIALLLAGVLGIVVIGHYLGMVAEVIVVALKIPEAAVGWVLGVVTSLPEMTTFFVVFRAARGSADGLKACQLGLDNLAASNMSNIGLIYPIGIVVFLWVTSGG